LEKEREKKMEGDNKLYYISSDEEEYDGDENEQIHEPKQQETYVMFSSNCYECSEGFSEDSKTFRCHWKCFDTCQNIYCDGVNWVIECVYCEKCWENKLLIWDENVKDERVCQDCLKITCWSCGYLFGDVDKDCEFKKQLLKKNERFYCDNCSKDDLTETKK